MQMTDDEIVRHYREARNKAKDIPVLADLNDCKPKEIREILIRAGELPQPAAPPKKPEPPQDEGLLPPSPQGECSRRGQRGRSGPPDASGVYSRVEQILDAIPGDASDRSRGFAFDLCLALFVDDMKKRLGIGKEAAGEQTKT